MKCPKCGSSETKRVSAGDPHWTPSAQRCKACGYQADWVEFSREVKQVVDTVAAQVKRVRYDATASWVGVRLAALEFDLPAGDHLGEVVRKQEYLTLLEVALALDGDANPIESVEKAFLGVRTRRENAKESLAGAAFLREARESLAIRCLPG